MAAPSLYQDPETRKVSFWINARAYKILEKLAEQRGMELFRFIKEHVEHVALDHKSLVPLTMPPEHYTARDGDDETIHD